MPRAVEGGRRNDMLLGRSEGGRDQRGQMGQDQALKEAILTHSGILPSGSQSGHWGLSLEAKSQSCCRETTVDSISHTEFRHHGSLERQKHHWMQQQRRQVSYHPQ